MSRLRLLLLIAGAALALAWGTDRAAADPTHYGDGLVHVARMPWLTGTTRVLTQGWGGCYQGRSHCAGNSDQYATDWGGTFNIYAVTEGDATCVEQVGWGFRVIVNRRNNNLFYDRYAHLPNCPWGTKHLEQGDFISQSGDSGDADGVHLHYQMETGAGQSQQFALSGHDNFCDHTISGFCTGFFDNDNFVSDNAGPGVGAPTAVKNQIYWQYVVPPHAFGQNAWDVWGSSMYVGAGPMAFHNCLSLDCGWHQVFQNASTIWNEFNKPDACAKAYIIPDEYFLAYYWSYSMQLGQARSSVIYVPSDGHYQFFRYGYMWSTAYGTDPTVVLGVPTTGCYD